MRMKLLSVLTLSLCFSFTLNTQGSTPRLKVIKIESKEVREYVKETLIQVGVDFDPISGTSVIEVRFDGTLKPPEKLNPDILVATNKSNSILGFNMRLGVDVYNVYIIDVSGKYIAALPTLKEIVGRQIQSVDASLSDDSFILKNIDDTTLTFKYVGKEISPNYFEFKGSIKDGQVTIDKKSLKSTILSIKL